MRMKLSDKLNLIFVLAGLAGLTVAIACYFILAEAYREDRNRQSLAEVNVLLEQQLPYLSQEFVNDRFYAASMRGKDIVASFAKQGLEVGLYRADGSIIFESEGAAALKRALGKVERRALSVTTTHAIETRAMNWAGDPIGALLFALPLGQDADPILKNSLYAGILVLLGVLSLLFFAVRAATSRYVVRPISRLNDVLPQIPRFLNGETQVLLPPEGFGSRELDKVAETLKQVAAQLKTAISAEQTALVRGKRNEAIAMTTQMMAHDVRKPFSMLRMGLELLSRERDAAAQRRVALQLIPEVERSMLTVNSMLKDVMEIGSGGNLNLEALSLPALVDGAIAGVLALYPDAEVTFERRFATTPFGMVDAQKLQRVLHNILENAVQALDGRGRVLISLRVIDGKWLELAIQNDGPTIEAADLPHVFDAFFTKNKRRGTGLGLAIAHKVVSEHGGTIRCESSAATGTQFVLTVPAASAAVIPLAPPPTASSRVRSAPQRPMMTRVAAPSHLALRALVIDDEPIYCEALAQIAASTPEFTVDRAGDAAQALALAQANAPALIICDLDLGPRAIDGFEIIRMLRAQGVEALICVHSNRDTKADRAKAQEAGADLYLPKPMTRAQWAELASRVARPTVLFVDDCIFTREAWEATLPEVNVRTFGSPEELWLAIEKEPELLAEALGLITDYHFDEASTQTGLDLARSWREKSRVPILLCSNADTAAGERASFDGVLAKAPPQWVELSRRLAVGNSRTS